MLDFYTRIDDLLKEKKANQKDLAESIGLASAQVFTNWKSRNSIPSADIAYKIAAYLNTTVEFLVTGKETDVYKENFRNLLEDLQTVLNKYKQQTILTH